MKVSAVGKRRLWDIEIGIFKFQGVAEFSCLGAILSNENEMSKAKYKIK